MNNKAQMKMMETIAVLIVFIVILVFVMIFYVSISQASAGKRVDEKSNLKAIEISQFVSYLPEFQCSSRNIIEENCFDKLKLQTFITYTTYDAQGARLKNTTYYDFFKESKVVVYEIYPGDQVWEIYNREPEKELFEQRESHIPISLYDPLRDEFSFGMLNVTVYS